MFCFVLLFLFLFCIVVFPTLRVGLLDFYLSIGPIPPHSLARDSRDQNGAQQQQ